MIRPLAISPLALFAVVACVAPADGEETGRTGTVRSAILRGSPSSAAQDSVVDVVFSDPDAGLVLHCTGTLLAPRLVLTARHCVAVTASRVSCSADGTANASDIEANHDARALYVVTGAARQPFDPQAPNAAGRGLKIIDDGSSTLCNHDIALIVLEAPVAGAQIASIRLDGQVAATEHVSAVGWGVTETTAQPSVRQERAGVAITRVGPDDLFPPLPPNEFQIGEATCGGDSGGPALSGDTGAVVGVVSRGTNFADELPGDPSSLCVDAINVYTKIAPFKELLLRGYAEAGAEPRIEQPKEEPSCTMARRRGEARGDFTGAERGLAGFAAVALLLASARRRARRSPHAVGGAGGRRCS